MSSGERETMHHDVSGTGNLLRNLDVGEMLRLREQVAESDRRAIEAETSRDELAALLDECRIWFNGCYGIDPATDNLADRIRQALGRAGGK